MKIPRTLDRPTRVLGVPFDLAMISIGIYYFFVLLNSGLIGVSLALIGANLYSRVRSRTLFRNIQRIVYWYLPSELTKESGIPGHIRRIKFSEFEYDKE